MLKFCSYCTIVFDFRILIFVFYIYIYNLSSLLLMLANRKMHYRKLIILMYKLFKYNESDR